MLAVIFEVYPTTEKKAEYLQIAAELRGFLESRDGFISIERFQSLSDDGKILSLSFWRDEAAIKEWRNLIDHRAAQKRGGILSFDPTESALPKLSGITQAQNEMKRLQIPKLIWINSVVEFQAAQAAPSAGRPCLAKNDTLTLAAQICFKGKEFTVKIFGNFMRLVSLWSALPHNLTPADFRHTDLRTQYSVLNNPCDFAKFILAQLPGNCLVDFSDCLIGYHLDAHSACSPISPLPYAFSEGSAINTSVVSLTVSRTKTVSVC